ncbi:hypothetical protein HMPREF9420_0164 [Segatella salivae DSM 15606]|uniref:Uncharacterized protein n=1 Tax=Segatella salivae DSM 15606 TaxID=888832 RepID=E6MKZ7_9BACT|nr:hypothetical protein HMPREF9420_0164 [Segatella salivae DSM 15606]
MAHFVLTIPLFLVFLELEWSNKLHFLYFSNLLVSLNERYYS